MKEKIKALAAYNAMEHNGKADFNSVISKVIAYFPEVKKNLKEIIPEIREAIEIVNSMTQDQQKAIVSKEYPELLEKKKKEEERKLPELPDIPSSGVVMRMAPSPSGPLHIGHARMAILNDEYVRRYGGKLILRIEDTNPANIDPNAYEMIADDLKWLEVNVTDTVIQSDRFEIYYDVMEKLIKMGKAYVATSPTEEFKSKRQKGLSIEEREESPQANLERWKMMLNGEIKKGEGYAVIKTDLSHPNPAIRDFIAFRILEIEHPLKGNKYRVYPMMNFSVAVDDHYLGLTHVIRGKDHLANTEKQKYIFNYFNWKMPYYIHYGKVSIENSILKTSIIKKGIKSGEYSGWDDPRLGTLVALKKRGFNPGAIRRYWIETGIGDVDILFSWENFYAFNRQIIDKFSPRHFFVKNPIALKFKYEGTLKSKIPIYPGNEHTSFREYEVKSGDIFITREDYEKYNGKEIRLKDLGNFLVKDGSIEYLNNDTDVIKKGMPIIHWIQDKFVNFEIMKPDGTKDKGYLESYALSEIGKVHQLERYGYVNIINEKEGVFTHP
ncbi:MAG: glutamate--tRNA ligase [Thermoplasmata archaeon]